jgi:hypothetical protein
MDAPAKMHGCVARSRRNLLRLCVRPARKLSRVRRKPMIARHSRCIGTQVAAAAKPPTTGRFPMTPVRPTPEDFA